MAQRDSFLGKKNSQMSWYLKRVSDPKYLKEAQPLKIHWATCNYLSEKGSFY